MAAFSKEEITYRDQEVYEISQLFYLDSENPTLGMAGFQRDRLDYSLESLEYINKYLENIRKNPEIKRVWNRVVLRCGAYLGEVIRRNCKVAEYHWVDFDTALKIDPVRFKKFGKRVETSFVLYSESGVFCIPMAKVVKFLEYGAEDNVRLFAEVMVG